MSTIELFDLTMGAMSMYLHGDKTIKDKMCKLVNLIKKYGLYDTFYEYVATVPLEPEIV